MNVQPCSVMDVLGLRRLQQVLCASHVNVILVLKDFFVMA